ncbi:glycoside hydrolase family 20 zincin-like fold domain-containing protein [Bifidobacterium sp. SO1]|uniref:beta-N-acetylhexosaminidase n=1 Tax=Bifidobacterium sp. SO1 TaxID=2809029 RepID=UPI001BDD4FCB|nr:glycoside hydrolase family 20 zincin-like fold domain-containing protein [Bifidobacterium sp. SO1]MBT1162668.1 family 20 glycosylhydrolase [Bifidobacterium sp. SO1]
MQYSVEGESKNFELIPQPRNISIEPDAYVLLPYVDRIVETENAGDTGCVLANQIVDDIEAATGLRWDVANSDRWQSFITLSIANSVAADDIADDAAAKQTIADTILDETGSDDDHQRNRSSEPADIPTVEQFSPASTSPLAPTAYRLTISPDGITVVGGSAAGLRDGVQTLRQIIRQCAPTLPVITIADQPAYAVRGYYLDATRGRVPTLDWLKTWADKLCLYKYNQLQLYIEHTFAFDGLSETWRGASPLKPADIIAFDDYCAARGIELVPSVSTFGHHYTALRTHELRRLGEFPDQADRPFSLIERLEHHTLNITEPDALMFSFTLIDDYLGLFRTRKFNICGDETFDLGKGLSKPEADRRGVAAMYADYVTRLCQHLSEQGREPLFWGDIAIEHPEILDRLPHDVTLLNWLYAPDIDDDKVRLVAQSGATQYVCPAVWCWNALLPRLDWAWNNISRLARYGLRYGAAGFLVTDWGDFGHVNDPRMAIPGMIYGAQCAWDPDWTATCDGCGCCESGCCGSGCCGSGNTGLTLDDDEYDSGDLSCDACVDDDRCVARDAGESAHVELDRRISIVEYGDRGGTFVAALRDASRQVTFSWMNIVRYAELDYGDGSLNTDVRDSIWTGSDAEAAERIHASATVDEARRHLLAWLVDTAQDGADGGIRRTVAANSALRAAEARMGAAMAGASDHGAAAAGASDEAGSCGRIVQAVRIAAEGQRLFNELGWCLAVRAGVLDGEASGGADMHAYAQTVARGLERWFEAYADVWRTVSAESELRRIADVVWRCADLLRA